MGKWHEQWGKLVGKKNSHVILSRHMLFDVMLLECLPIAANRQDGGKCQKVHVLPMWHQKQGAWYILPLESLMIADCVGICNSTEYGIRRSSLPWLGSHTDTWYALAVACVISCPLASFCICIHICCPHPMWGQLSSNCPCPVLWLATALLESILEV